MIKLNGKIITPTIFPDKTSQVWKLDSFDLEVTTMANISWYFESEAELIHIAQLKDLLDKYNRNVNLYIDYLPYARQDKNVSNETTFALHTFANLINSLNFDLIEILDPHSDLATKLIKRSYARYPAPELMNTVATIEATRICYPDKGAFYKYAKKYDHITVACPFVIAEKVRDQLTGAITSIEIIEDGTGVNGQSVLIVDDICDAGGTFIGLAKILLAKGAREVNLFVTHGLFTKGIEVLKQSGINRIFTHTGERTS